MATDLLKLERPSGLAPDYSHWQCDISLYDSGRKLARLLDSSEGLSGNLPNRARYTTAQKVERPTGGRTLTSQDVSRE